MKRFLLNSLIAMAVMIVGTISAFAEEYVISPSAVTTINPSDVDVNYYDASATSWRCSQSALSGTSFKGVSGSSYMGPILIMQIDLAQLDGLTIQEAVLSYDSKCTVSGKNSNVTLASMTADWDPTTVTFTGIAADAGAVQISAGTGQNVGTSTKNLKEDVLNAVKDMAGKKVAFAIYTYTAREQEISNIKLTVKAISASASADVQLKYMCGEAEVKTATIIGTIGNTVSLSAAEKANFVLDGKKYIYVSDNAADVTVAAEGTVVIINVREADIYNYSIVSSQGGVVATGTGFEGDAVEVGYPRYQLIDGTLYEAPKTNDSKKQYRVTVNLTQDNVSVNMIYNSVKENIAFYQEAEDIEGLTKVTYGNVAVRASNALAAKADEDKVITTLPAGKYAINAGVFSSAKSPAYVIKIGVGSDTYEAPVTAVNNSEVKSGEYNVAEGTEIVLYAEGMGDNNALDYIYIQKTGEYEAPEPEVATITITKGEKVITVASSNNTYALQTKFAPMSSLDEGETPESVVLEILDQMDGAFSSAQEFNDYYVEYTTKGEKEIDIEGMEEVFPGEKFFISACNIAWSPKEGKPVLASNVAVDYYDVPVPQEPEDEIVLDVVDPDVSDTEIWNIYDNEDYKVYFDIVKNLPLDPSRTYTLEDMDPKYSYIYSKNDIVTNEFGTKNWQKYEYTSANVKIGANNELVAVVEAKNGENVIKGKFVFTNPEVITVTLNGETKFDADADAYAVSAKNKGSELKADYSVQFGVKAEAYESKTTFTEEDLMTNGNSIRVATKETKIVSANITLTVGAESQTFEGTVVGADEKTYAINVTTNIPSKEAKKETVDFGAVLEVSEDEGDIKLVAENDDAKFVGYITVNPVTTDVPSGEYELLSYTKYGVNSDFGYMLDAVEDGKVTVTNNEGEISIVATFKQNNVEYTVSAKAGAPEPEPEMATITITKGEKVITVTSSNETYALQAKFAPMSSLEEGQTPETVVLAILDEMDGAFSSAQEFNDYYVQYATKGEKEIDLEGIEEVYPGEKLFFAACNIAWSPKEGKPVLASNIAVEYYDVPAPKPENTELTKDMFFTWTSAGADAEHAEDQSKTWCDYVLNQSTGMPYGNGNVDWMQYADISAYEHLVVTATAGTPRFFLNRKTANGQAPNDAIDTNNGDHFAAYVQKVDNGDGSFNFILDIAKIVSEQGFAHLNVIKGGNWADTTVTKMLLVNGEIPTGISNATISSAMKVGKFVENGKVVIVKNGKKFSVSGAQMK